MKRVSAAVLAFAVLSALMTPVRADVITAFVHAKDSIYFSGRTSDQVEDVIDANATWSVGDYYGDVADTDTIPSFVDVTALGSMIDISATGLWTHGPCCAPTGPEGKGVAETSQDRYGIFGISLLTADLNMLVGVFLDDLEPMLGSVPDSLSTEDGDDMTSPLLRQAFAIGAGLENLTVPDGATRLFLGMHDGFEWTNNSGRVEVHIKRSVPEPATITILGIGLLGIASLRRRSTA